MRVGRVTLRPLGKFGQWLGSRTSQRHAPLEDGGGPRRAGNHDDQHLPDLTIPTGVAGLTNNAVVPNLTGTVARISGNQNFADALVESLGTGFSSQGQNASGVLQINYSGGALRA